MDKYRIEFSNKSKTPFEVGYRTFNSQTTLTLSGKNTVNYGKEVNSSLYHLLESFCNDIPPADAIEGQNWYDTTKKTLNVFDGTNWISVGRSVRPTIPDNAASPGFVEVATSQFLKMDGGDMTGPLLLKSTSFDDNDNAAVTKKYVDTAQPKEISGLVSINGNVGMPTPTGTISTTSQPSQPNHATTKTYADSTVPHIIKSIDENITLSSGTATGKINTVHFLPLDQVHMFGVVNIPTTSPYVDIKLPIPTITNECILVNSTGTFDNTVDVSAYITLNSNSESVFRIIKHGTLTKAVSVNFSVSGLKV